MIRKLLIRIVDLINWFFDNFRGIFFPLCFWQFLLLWLVFLQNFILHLSFTFPSSFSSSSSTLHLSLSLTLPFGLETIFMNNSDIRYFCVKNNLHPSWTKNWYSSHLSSFPWASSSISPPHPHPHLSNTKYNVYQIY